MKMFHLVLIVFSFALTGNVFGAEGYFCTADHVAGFSFNSAAKQWGASVFKAEEKLLITRSNADEAQRGYFWHVREVGSSFPKFSCKSDFNEAGYLHCTGFGSFSLNKRNNRFLSTYTVGYVTDNLGEKDSISGPEGSDTPAISIGKCSPL